jgi:hypothetical protein
MNKQFEAHTVTELLFFFEKVDRGENEKEGIFFIENLTGVNVDEYHSFNLL